MATVVKRLESNTKFLGKNANKAFILAFIEAAFFTSEEEAGSNPTVDKIARPDLLSIIEQCNQFITVASAKGILDTDSVDMEQAGHDFWLTRNGHGTGFWDRDDDVYGEGNGNQLTELCGYDKMFAEVNLESSGRKIYIYPMYNRPTQADQYEVKYTPYRTPEGLLPKV